MIKIQALTKSFGAYKAVDGLSLDVAAGEIFGFLGPNGAGKTTTVKILSGIMKPTAGRVLVGGHDIVTEPLEAKRMIAYIPDEPFVYPKLTGFEFLRFIGDIYSVPYAEQVRRIPELLELFELSAAGGELLEAYSHGMKQKLLIAGVLLRKPKVVLFDEPTVGLDPKSIRRFKDLLLEHGIRVDDAHLRRLIGMPTTEILKELKRKYKFKENIQDLREERRYHYFKFLGNRKIAFPVIRTGFSSCRRPWGSPSIESPIPGIRATAWLWAIRES